MSTVSTVTGPIFLGHLFNWLYTVFAFEVLQTAFATHSGWYALASGWGNPAALIDVTWSLALIPALTGIVSALGQLFFVWRIWILGMGNRKFLPLVIIIILLSSGSLAAALYCGLIGLAKNNLELNNKTSKDVIILNSLSAACDTIITVTLLLQLATKQSDSFSTANHIIHKAMRVAIETGAATTIAAFVGLALYVNNNTSTWGLANGKVYANALLANLNSRTKIVDTVESGQSQTGVQIWQVRTQGVSVDSALAQHTIDRQNDNGNIELSEFLSPGAKSEPLLDSV
ncbi:hypothetical protein EV361DRAFT_953762 [Lentinula raphanica]|nr:hypothetical protein F5880DRAFT_1615316 [Lentinula raphanica]KAJ3966808.1 hypothetical protein EV361DRAFT_953762 [Lentinula raphanica]